LHPYGAPCQDVPAEFRFRRESATFDGCAESRSASDILRRSRLLPATPTR
jgi:hypothetical protein